jgi:hypothetical protein
MKKAVLVVLFLALVGAIAAVPTFADVPLVSTLGPGGTFDTTNGDYVDSTGGADQVVADPFSLSFGAAVSDAQLALGNVSGNNDPVNVYIESDNAGSPGSIIASLTQAETIGPYVIGPGGGGLVTFNCSGPACTLAAGSYWLVAQEPDAGTEQEWNWSFNDARTNLAINHVGSATGPWITTTGIENGFELDGAPTPEPSSFLLLGSGLAGLAGMLRRKLKG